MIRSQPFVARSKIWSQSIIFRQGRGRGSKSKFTFTYRLCRTLNATPEIYYATLGSLAKAHGRNSLPLCMTKHCRRWLMQDCSLLCIKSDKGMQKSLACGI